MTYVARLLLASLLIGAALIVWSASGLADDLANRHQQIATFRDSAPDRAAIRPWTQLMQTTIDSGSEHDASTRDYWHRRYEALTGTATSRERDDPASQLIAANATFRQLQREAGGRSLTVDELDRALQAYAGVLKNGGFDRDAAWNYEYIARLRDIAAKEKPASRQPGAKPPANAPPMAVENRGGLPAGPTVHGRPGTHPPSTKGEQFEVITPMDYGDREAQPEPTPGVRLPRKG
jgi:hypothetical protein